MGDTEDLGYAALVWPEVMHQLEGGVMKKAVERTIRMVRGFKKGKKGATALAN